MRVCMLAYTFYETDNRVRRYGEALARRGDKVDAISLAREGQKRAETMLGVRVLRIQKRRINERNPFSYLIKLMLFFFRSAWVVTREHLREPYSIIHVHSVPDFEVFATLIPKLLGARVILDIHDLVPEFYAGKFRISESALVFRLLLMVERLSVAFADHVIISNHLWYDKIVQRSATREKCTAIINYPDCSIFRQQPRTDSGQGNFVMCYPGTLNSHQGLDVAIDAVALLREEAPNLRFFIVGDGPDRDMLKTMIREHKLEDRVWLRGFVAMEEVAAILSTVDLGVVPKRKDSFGNEAFSTKILEFMAMGVPVVVARTRIDEYYFNDTLVEFFESGDARNLAGRILGLIRNPARRNELRQASATFVAQNNWDVKKHEYLALADALCRKGTSAAGAKVKAEAGAGN